jgi:hypothetical protein
MELVRIVRCSVWRRRHELCDEILVGFLGLFCFLFLFIDLFLHKDEELIHRDVLEVPIICINKPLKYFLKGVLSPLLVGHVVALG